MGAKQAFERKILGTLGYLRLNDQVFHVQVSIRGRDMREKPHAMLAAVMVAFVLASDSPPADKLVNHQHGGHQQGPSK